jgi:hypothetical protein
MNLLKIFSIGLLSFSITSPVVARELPEPSERELTMLYIFDSITEPEYTELGIIIARPMDRSAKSLITRRPTKSEKLYVAVKQINQQTSDIFSCELIPNPWGRAPEALSMPLNYPRIAKW